MRQRNAGCARGAESRGDSRNNGATKARSGQGLDLFSAAPEDVWVAALQPNHPAIGTRVLNQQFVNATLPYAVKAPE